MSDLISRADAIDALCHNCAYYTDAQCKTDSGYWCESGAMIREAIPSAEFPKSDLISRADAICEVLVNDGIDNIVDRINALPSAEAEWIPCSERLPETHTEYVTENPWMQVTVGEDTYQLSDAVLGYGRRKHHSKDDPMMSVVWYEDDGEGRTAWQTAPDCEDIEVIAWMPLPKPYREDGET